MSDNDYELDVVFGGTVGNLTGTDAISDIRRSRARLGEFTLRFAYEAIYGDDVARRILGETGGNIKLKDLKVSIQRDKKTGAIVTKLDEDQMRQLFPHEYGNKQPTQKPAQTDQQAILKMMTKMSDEDRSTLLKLLKKEG